MNENETINSKTIKHKKSKISKILGCTASFLAILAVTTACICAYTYYVRLSEAAVEKTNVIEPYVKSKIEIEQEKIANIVMSLKPQLDPAIANVISISIIKHSNHFNVPTSLVISIINRESEFNTLAVSSMGARGLMQIMTKVHKDKIKKIGIDNYKAMHIDNNIQLGCSILREYFNTEKSTEKALERYVGGQHKEYISDVLSTYLEINMMLAGNLKIKEPVKSKDTAHVEIVKTKKGDKS